MLWSRRLRKLTRSAWPKRFLLSTSLLCVTVYQWGVFSYLGEKTYAEEFSYPLDMRPEEMQKLVAHLRSKRGRVEVEPVNRFEHPFLWDAANVCRDEPGTSAGPIELLFVVKSALDHFDRREVIRQTWGWTKRFSDVEMRRVFLLGVPAKPDPALQSRIDAEALENSDIVQAAFVDSYYNNTIKTSMGLHWVVTHCPQARYIMTVDDDYYVSAKNALRYLRRPGHYPMYLQHAFPGLEVDIPLPPDAYDEDSKEVRMYAGYVFASSKPHRLFTSTWYVSLKEYPYDRYPPYVTAGAVLMSAAALSSMYYASLYTVPFRFDDIYLTILAKKAGIVPSHNPNFYFHKPPYSRAAYAFMIASHGYDEPGELLKVWKEQRTLGNA